jgi:hypothetical protein
MVMREELRSVAVVTFLVCGVCATNVAAQRGRGAPPGPALPKTSAPFDLTGHWVALITEDWRYRQFTPPKGDYGSVPLSPVGRKIADAWDPAKDEAGGDSCKPYGAAGLMRLPTRLHITWQDDATLKIDADAGTQTRLFYFGEPRASGGNWQGVSIASWDAPRAPMSGRGGAGPAPMSSLKVVTTKMRPGYLRKNGVPYSSDTVMTEYFDRLDVPGGDALLLVRIEIVDPQYLAAPYWTSVQFKRQNDAAGWNPTPCAAR